ncbi:hypothetical protein [Enterobacter kobei]|uniref:hypothetical protein n=1 Tax=Enterobacter kobei TaxID=208224 RepID=UPI000DCB717C|nr:hypothetical protein [Enterobacter kobei]RAY25824.1 hypothetical protein DP184_16375 [Enterobacter kobei]HDT5687071.1 hypothetical protein [Enterobacter kobei]HDV9257673.1 hypothetical protein [Enterobacter kobei]
MDSKELFDRIFALELQVGFLIPKMIRAMDKLSVNNGVSTYLIAEMENLVKELPNSAASHDERFLNAAMDALATVKRSLDQPPSQE